MVVRKCDTSARQSGFPPPRLEGEGHDCRDAGGRATHSHLVLVLVQIGWSLITANTSGRLRAFGASLGEYLRQIIRFITYNSDDMPFPFADWPELDQDQD